MENPLTIDCRIILGEDPRKLPRRQLPTFADVVLAVVYYITTLSLFTKNSIHKVSDEIISCYQNLAPSIVCSKRNVVVQKMFLLIKEHSSLALLSKENAKAKESKRSLMFPNLILRKKSTHYLTSLHVFRPWKMTFIKIKRLIGK